MAVFTAIFTAIGTAIGTALSFAVGSAAMAITIGATVAIGNILIFGGLALSATLMANAMAKNSFTASSPTYSSPTLQTQTNPDLPVPLLYGRVKLAGNRIWQDDNTEDGIKRIVAFAEGRVEEFADIRLNDIESSKISGIKIQKFYGTSAQGLPKGLTTAKVGSLKNIAYLYIEVPRGEKIDINYNLTAIVKGRRIRVYTTPTDYEVKYSNNPAWVLFDFLTCYNGRGLCLNDDGTKNNAKIAEMFDMNSFIEAAAFCDEEVITDGVASPRFRFNMIFDSQTSHRTLLDEIYRNCRGVLAVKNGKLQFKIDKAEATKKVFNATDIINGSETFQTIPYEEHYDILKIDYISPKHEWQKVQAFAEIPEYRDGVPIEHQVNCYSVTNFQQASRLAWYYINSKVLCPYFGSFQTGFKGADLEVGDVISIPVMLMGLSDYLVKVTSVIDNGTGIYTVNYRTYNPALYSDTLGSQEPTAIVTNLSDAYYYPADVQNFNVVQQDNYYLFTWQKTNDTDVYEIRYGANWDIGEVIGKNIALNNFSYQIRSKGLKHFWIKAKNEYNYSENPTEDVIVISDIPETNIIVTYNTIQDFSNNLYQTRFYKGFIKLDYDVASQEVIDGNILNETYDGNDYSGNLDGIIPVYTYGTYTSNVYDLGDELECHLSYDLNYMTESVQANVRALWRYSSDNANWTDWQDILSGSVTFRYAQFRIELNSPDEMQIYCDKFSVTVDVPDRFETREIEITDISGETIQYNYLEPPSIVATVNDNITAYAVITSKTNKQATVMVYNNNGTATTGNVSLYIKGY